MTDVIELDEREPGKIYFVMDELPHPAGSFVELEDAAGAGMSLGRWVKFSTSRFYALEIDDPRHGFNASVDLTDQEMELIVKGLWAIDSDEPGVPELVKKLGLESPPLETATFSLAKANQEIDKVLAKGSISDATAFRMREAAKKKAAEQNA